MVGLGFYLDVNVNQLDVNVNLGAKAGSAKRVRLATITE